jgi:HK97 gp10 family phage protein
MAKYRANGVEVKGLRRVVREVEKLGVEVQDLKAVFTRIGARALSTANAGTPVSTGALKASNKQSKRKNSVYLYSGNAKARYAIYPHYGTKYQPANPYLQNAVKKDGPWAVQELDRELGNLIRKVGLNR